MTAPRFCAACGAWLDFETHQCSELWLKGTESEGRMDESNQIPQNVVVDINNRFTYHAPKEGQPLTYEQIREAAKSLALLIAGLCPDSRERSLAITHLEEVVFWANASIARKR